MNNDIVQNLLSLNHSYAADAADEIERLRSEWGATKTCTSCSYFDTEYSTDGWGWCDRYAASRPVDHFCAEWQEACRG